MNFDKFILSIKFALIAVFNFALIAVIMIGIYIYIFRDSESVIVKAFSRLLEVIDKILLTRDILMLVVPLLGVAFAVIVFIYLKIRKND